MTTVNLNCDAIEFVKQNGIEKVKQIVELFPLSTMINIDGVGVSISDLKQIVDAFDLVGELGGLERVKNAINGKHIGYTHFYLHSNDRYVFLDHYVDFIPDHVQHIGMFNKVIELVEKCNES